MEEENSNVDLDPLYYLIKNFGLCDHEKKVLIDNITKEIYILIESKNVSVEIIEEAFKKTLAIIKSQSYLRVNK